MALVTVLAYQSITGDDTSAGSAVEEWIDRSVAKLEDALDRKIESGERTERMYPTRDGSLWPHAIPITVAPDGLRVDGNRLYGGLFTFGTYDPVTGHSSEFTYTGGWVERSANPSAANRLPACIEEDIAIGAWVLGHPQPLAVAAQIPAGATSVRLGDAAVSYGPGGAPGARARRIQWSAKTLGYRYVRIGGEPC
jgi:hypothetical protein